MAWYSLSVDSSTLLLLTTVLVGCIGIVSLTRPRKRDARRCFGCSDIAYAFFFPRFEVSKDVAADAERATAMAELAELQLQVERSEAELVRRRERRDTLALAAQDDGASAVALADDAAELTDEEHGFLARIESGEVKLHTLEKVMGDCERAVKVRRHFFARLMERLASSSGVADIPYTGYDYKSVLGRNCEAVVGYIPLPVGVIGPIAVDGEPVFIPMATTEGCLVASTNRGCKVITESGGCTTVLTRDGMTRAPVIKLPSCGRAAQLCAWCEVPANVDALAAAFSSTTRFGKLQAVHGRIAGNLVRAPCVDCLCSAHLVRTPPHRAHSAPASPFPPTPPGRTSFCARTPALCRSTCDSSAQQAMRWA